MNRESLETSEECGFMDNGKGVRYQGPLAQEGPKPRMARVAAIAM